MNNDDNNEIDKFYNLALQFTKSHYENFPVVSFLIKKDLRKHIALIYQFARQADDFADEGNFSQDERITKLNNYDSKLRASFSSQYENGFWRNIKLTIDQKELSERNFQDLLIAFKQDVWKKRYKDYDELLNYCKNSANPVGRLILELHSLRDEVPKNYSDKICTALQLTNFYQDVSLDIAKGRIYIPEDELRQFDVSEQDIVNSKISDKFRELIKFQIERTKTLFSEGKELLKYLPIRLKFQILITIKGGEAILKKIEDINYNVLEKRPTLSKVDFIKLFVSAIFIGR